MAQFWTRKKEEDKEDTIQAEDFLKRVAQATSKDKMLDKPKIENTK